MKCHKDLMTRKYRLRKTLKLTIVLGNILTDSHVVKAHANGTGYSWKDESYQKVFNVISCPFMIDVKGITCVTP